MDITLFILIGISVTFLVIGVIVAYRHFFRDAFRKFGPLGEPLGKFELNETLGRSKAHMRRRTNMVELTDTFLDRGAGTSLKAAFLDEMREQLKLHPERDLADIRKIIETVSNADPATLFVDDRFRFRIFGVGAIGSPNEIYATVIDANTDLRAIGNPAYSRRGGTGTTILYLRKFQLANKLDFGELGMMRVSLFVPFELGSTIDEKQYKAMENIHDNLLPYLGGISQVRSLSLQVNHLRNLLEDAKRQLAQRDFRNSETLAAAISGNAVLRGLALVLGIKSASGTRATWMMISVMICTIVSAAVVEYGFHNDPILGVIIGSFIGGFVASTTAR